MFHWLKNLFIHTNYKLDCLHKYGQSCLLFKRFFWTGLLWVLHSKVTSSTKELHFPTEVDFHGPEPGNCCVFQLVNICLAGKCLWVLLCTFLGKDRITVSFDTLYNTDFIIQEKWLIFLPSYLYCRYPLLFKLIGKALEVLRSSLNGSILSSVHAGIVGFNFELLLFNLPHVWVEVVLLDCLQLKMFQLAVFRNTLILNVTSVEMLVVRKHWGNSCVFC